MSSETTYGREMRRLLDPSSSVRAHYITIAKNFLALDGSIRSIAVSALESGIGRSSVCIGLGAALVGMGCRAAIIDCNLQRPHLHRTVGEPNFVGLTSALETGKSLEGYGHEIIAGLLAVPTGPVLADAASYLDSERFGELVRGLESSRDVVILDAPVVGEMLRVRTLLKGLDGVLLVLHGSRTSRRSARKSIGELQSAGAKVLGLILNAHS